MNKWVVFLILGIIAYFFFFDIDREKQNYEKSELREEIKEVSNPIPKKEPFPEIVESIYLKQEDLDYLNNRFLTESDEFRVCLYGETYLENSLLVTSWVVPLHHQRSPLGVTAEDCSRDSLGFIHSHPNQNCLPSTDDKNLARRQIFPIQGIICGKDRVTFYTKQNPEVFIKPRLYISENQSKEIVLRNPCPPGENICKNHCYKGCTSQGTWRCLSTGGDCLCRPGVSHCNL
jgi:hypothetical protein